MMSGPRSTKPEQGAVAIVVAILSVVLIGMLAFVADLGMAYANKRVLQNGADAAVLAVANELIKQSSPAENCAAMASRQEVVRAFATSHVVDNAQGTSGVSLQGYSLVCEPPGLVVSATAAMQSPAFFGGIFGAGELPLAQPAKAVVGPVGSVVGVRPIAICEVQADQLRDDPTVTQTFDIGNDGTDCGAAAGNWGMLDLADGNNGTGNTEEWLLSGFATEISATSPGNLITGDPGTPQPALADEMEQIVGKTVTLPVFNLVTDNGSNATYTITGFVAVRVCGYRFKNKEGNDVVYMDDDSVQPGSCWDETEAASMPGDYYQFRFSQYIPVGELSTTCVLGDPCDGLRVAKLAD